MQYKLTQNILKQKIKSAYFVYSCLFCLLIGVITKINWIYENQGQPLLVASKHLVFKNGEYYRLFTSTLIHADLAHYSSNAIFLILFGFLLWSNFSFFVYPLLGLIGGTITNALSLLTYNDHTKLLGASGIVYFIAGLWLGLYFFIERDKSVMNRLVRIIAVVLVVFFPTQYEPNISYIAHFIGICLGFLFAIPYFLFNKKKIQKYEIWQEIWPEDKPEIDPL